MTVLLRGFAAIAEDINNSKGGRHIMVGMVLFLRDESVPYLEF
jgi:hypothetical protein